MRESLAVATRMDGWAWAPSRMNPPHPRRGETATAIFSTVNAAPSPRFHPILGMARAPQCFRMLPWFPRELFAQTRTCQQSDSPEIFSHRLPTVSLEGPSHLATREDHPKPGITRLRQLNISLEASRGSVKSARSYPRLPPKRRRHRGNNKPCFFRVKRGWVPSRLWFSSSR